MRRTNPDPERVDRSRSTRVTSRSRSRRRRAGNSPARGLPAGNQALQALSESGRLPDQVHRRQQEDDTERASGDGSDVVQRRASSQAGTAFATYTVKPGDTLWAIADRFGIEGGPAAIAEWNGMDIDEVIFPGDRLKLPASKLTGDDTARTDTDADDGWGFRDMAGKLLSGAAGWVAQRFSSTQVVGAETHVVKRGESLHDLAEKFGVSVGALKRANRDELRTWGDVQGFNAGATISIPAIGDQSTRESDEAETRDAASEWLADAFANASKQLSEFWDWLTRKFGEVKRWWVGERSVEERIQAAIAAETAAYQSLEIDVGTAEPVTVEPTYWINNRKEKYQDPRQERGPDFRAIEAALDEERATEQFRSSGGRDYRKGWAVKAAKASPRVLEEFIQKAVDEGVVAKFARSDPTHDYAGTLTQEMVQDWVNTRGVGVDCSGLVAHMITESRRALSEEDPRVNNTLARNLKDEGTEVLEPRNLRPGDVWITSNGNHVKMVAETTSPEAGSKFKTVESSPSGGMEAEGIRTAWETPKSNTEFGSSLVGDDPEGFYRLEALY